MRTKLLTLAVSGIAVLALGAGVGVAAAQGDGSDTLPPVTAPAGEYDSMDEMHAAMRDQMPAEFAAACDEMHAAMPEGMRSMDPGSMGGFMGTGMSGGFMTGQHGQHHR